MYTYDQAQIRKEETILHNISFLDACFCCKGIIIFRTYCYNTMKVTTYHNSMIEI